MNYINVFNDISTFNDISNGLSRPQLSYIPDSKLVFMLTAPAPPVAEIVDLGLSVKCAKYNVGATCGDNAESWYGNYYAWGETDTKTTYNWNTYKYCNGSENTLTKYNTKKAYGTVDGKNTLEPVDDAAVKTYPTMSMRIPTLTEIEELIDNTRMSRVWKTDYNGITGLNGLELTSIINGNKLFLPAAGMYSDSTRYVDGLCIYLWSSITDNISPTQARCTHFSQSEALMSGDYRYYGYPIRGVIVSNV